MSPPIEIQLLAAVVAAACALPGVFLILRRMALLSDAISHSVLLGIVLAFFVVRDLGSPVLLLGAAAMGVLTVALVEMMHRTRLVREDAAIGLVFPALFSLGVILISRYAGDVHLDLDAVLLGEIAFAPFDRLVVGGRDLGPRGLWVMGSILLLNAAAITNDPFVTYSFIFAAMAFIIFNRTKNLFTEKTVHFRFQSTIVDCFGSQDFTVRPGENSLRRCKGNTNVVEVFRNC